jgi:hypothetical protein
MAGVTPPDLVIHTNTIVFPVEMRIFPSFTYTDFVGNPQRFSDKRVNANFNHNLSFGGWAGNTKSAHYANSGNTIQDAHTFVFINVKANARL